ncbi:MAG TPA: 2-phospho-L-lactate transferase [Chloroflexota bacterium]|nr:2-phospho-L-lactate transferase [Chloroflexota bacterium]
MIVVLAGGVGAARFLQGLVQVVPPADITVVVNTADDLELHGLHVSPDLDSVLYHLAGIADEARGWGVRDETFHALDLLGRYGAETWFQLGDRDLATHIQRTRLLGQGLPLSAATDRLRRALRVGCPLLPMTDAPVATEVQTPDGWLPFQVYFVQRRCADTVLGIRFRGVEAAPPGPGVLEAIGAAQAVILAPSNPIVSLGPILAVPGVRAALRETAAPVAAISPIVGGAAIKGPADRMLRDLGHEVSPVGVAAHYGDLLDAFVLDAVDAALAPRVEALGLRALVTNTVMRGPAEKAALARATLAALGLGPG